MFMVELLYMVISKCTFYNMLICFEILDYLVLAYLTSEHFASLCSYTWIQVRN
jgi:hypothetical protein